MKHSLRSGFGAALAVALLTLPAAAEPNDAAATKLGDEAMQGDYLAMSFKAAEQKLKKALGQCKKGCSAPVRARLHRDLAIVYLAGLKKQDKGKQEMNAAVEADATVQLNPDFSTPEVAKAFKEAGGQSKEAEPEPATNELDEEPASEAAPAPAEPEEPPGAFRKNWISLSFQQDLLSYQETTNVCSGAAQYQCFAFGQSYAGPVYDRSGNQLSGGVGFATTRILLGYDRLFGKNIALGARLGFAFGGSPTPTGGGGSAFLPLHAELRGSYYFGEGFAEQGLRYYAGAAIGIAEVDGHVAVEYYPDEAYYLANRDKPGTLDAWRKTGNTMAAIHGGLAYALKDRHQAHLELRIMQMLGATAIGGAFNLGYSFGL